MLKPWNFADLEVKLRKLMPNNALSNYANGLLAKLSASLCLVLGAFVFDPDLNAQTSANKEGIPTDSVLLTLEGKVEVSPAAGAVWTLGRTNQVLKVGDRLRTGVRSRATVRLSNKSVLRVNELTTLKIQTPPQASNAPLLDLQSGSTYFFSREKPADVQFRTPLASGAIRGTEFNLAVAEDGRTVLSLLDGLVSMNNTRGEIDLKTGDQGIVEPGKPPTKTAVINAINIIQWCLYYPGVVDVDELGLSTDVQQSLSASLTAYRQGDLLQALANYPAGRTADSDSERVYYAALQLAVGQVDQTEAQLKELKNPSPLAEALREVIAAVKFQTWNRSSAPTLATESVAESYYLQSRSQLEAALTAAKAATAKSPQFGFAWARVAELEFSFGRTSQALEALEKALQFSPRNAQAISLNGFLLAARNQIAEAESAFDEAIAVDPALGNAWLGRGLCRIRQGRAEPGRQDLQVAAALEPNRSILRSYLGKAFSNEGNAALARKELGLAERLDPNDPTSWLYSALLNQQQNQVNEAVRDLEKSQDLNDNRSVFRSKLLLDQDRAVRSANLAAIYRDAGMNDVSVREASRAVNSDYASYSAHLFLANSYDALRDPKLLNLRYETPWLSELLVANLLAPVGAGSLSQYVSQQEYSKLFERDRLGVSSLTEYLSSGTWHQSGSEFGTLGDSSYAVDIDHFLDSGRRPNNDFESLSLSARFKQQLTPQDSVYVEAQYNNYESGDVRQVYNQATDGSATLRVKETQKPNFYIGYHHEWNPGSHTLLLAGRLQDTLNQDDPAATILTLNKGTNGQVTAVTPRNFGLNYERQLEAYSVELQQIWQPKRHTVVAGARFQTGWVDTGAELRRDPTLFPPIYGNPPSSQQLETELQRFDVYAYDYWNLIDSLQLTAGVSYDRLDYPRNSEVPPLSNEQVTKDRISPKAGLIWTPLKDTIVRGLYTRSLGGVFYDNSVRLEPTQIAGFNQAFRSLIPESVVGLVPGSKFETFGAAVDQKFKTGTYLSVVGEILNSEAERTVGVFDFAPPTTPAALSGTREHFDFRERTLTVTLNQLIRENVAVGASYRLSDADLVDNFVDIPVSANPGARRDLSATLHQVNLFVRFNYQSGLFSQFDTVWSQQSNRGYSPDIPGDDFWQFNVYVGYRFLQRRAELKFGLLNFTDQDYQLNPLTLYSELPRERTLAASFKFYF
jgi:tetratricopeptide (TPR) repeat protein